jgi:hypothetical protein
MTLRDDLIPVIDETRDLVEDLGLRLHVVKTRRRSWSGGEPGSGTPTDTDTTLTPAPKVSEPSPGVVAAAPGRYEQGDLFISKVSATYTQDELDGGTIGGDEEWWILVDDEPYRVVAATERAFEWRLHVRKLTGR